MNVFVSLAWIPKKISVWNYGSSDFLEYETKGTRSGQMAVPASSNPPPKET
jgi:hypothetical protein